MGQSLRSNVQWTLLGFVVFGACQWLTLVAIARLGSPTMVGQFTLSLSITAPLVLLLGLDLRTIQATDQSSKYRFEDLLLLRSVTMVMAMVAIIIAVLVAGYPTRTSAVVMLVGLSKCVEAVSELCHGASIQHEQLDRMARARILRGIMSVAAVAISIYFFNSLLIATMSLALMSVVLLVLYDLPMASRLLAEIGEPFSLSRCQPSQLWQLCIASLPAGILSCQTSLEHSIPRLCIEGYLGEQELGVFAAASSMMLVVMTIVNAVYCAVLPRMAKHFAMNQPDKAWNLMVKMGLFGVILGACSFCTAFACGAWLLQLVFGKQYTSSGSLLLILTLWATIRFATLPVSTGLRAAHRFWLLVAIQTLCLIGFVPAQLYFVQHYGLLGAAYGTVLLAGIYALTQLPTAFYALRPTATALAVLSSPPIDTYLPGAASTQRVA